MLIGLGQTGIQAGTCASAPGSTGGAIAFLYGIDAGSCPPGFTLKVLNNACDCYDANGNSLEVTLKNTPCGPIPSSLLLVGAAAVGLFLLPGFLKILALPIAGWGILGLMQGQSAALVNGSIQCQPTPISL